MNVEEPTVALIGPGAIGTTIAAALHEVGRTPLVCGRRAHPQLSLRFDGGTIVVPGPVVTEPSSVVAPFDLLFVAVKATQIAAIAPWLKALCHAQTVVCVLQNGVEQRALFAPHVAEATVLPSVVWFPAQREPEASVWLRAKPRLTLPDAQGAERVQYALRDTRCAVDISDDFLSVAWRKLLQNAVAGLMVLAGRRAGMFAREDITALDESVAQEIVAGFHRAPPDLSTSILTDREAGLPLEWDIRNGVVQRYGRIYHIATPLSDVIVPLLAAASACGAINAEEAINAAKQ